MRIFSVDPTPVLQAVQRDRPSGTNHE
jgi:hypothetical protein